MSDVNKQLLEAAKALESCDWSGVPIGNKAIIAQTIELLRARESKVIAAVEQEQQECKKCATCQGVGIVGHSEVCMDCIDTWQTGDFPAQQEADEQCNLLGDGAKQLKADHIQLDQWSNHRHRFADTYIQCGQEVLRSQHEKLYEALVAGLVSDEKGGK